MATGDTNDILARLRKVLPPWFPDTAPVLSALLTGFATVAAGYYTMIAFARLQMRIATATAPYLDLIAYDFFGRRIKRGVNQSDASFRLTITKEILRVRATRAGLRQMLIDLTGRTPVIFEPELSTDTGGYGSLSPATARGLAYGLAGGYGSLQLSNQFFVTAYRPSTSGIPLINGYGQPAGGYGQASRAAYGSLSNIVGAVTDADIYAAVASVIPAGSTAWTKLV